MLLPQASMHSHTQLASLIPWLGVRGVGVKHLLHGLSDGWQMMKDAFTILSITVLKPPEMSLEVTNRAKGPSWGKVCAMPCKML